MIVTLDFETAFDSDYSLKKMTTEAYVRDPRFKALVVGIKHDDRPAEWFTPDTFREYIAKFGLDVTVLCHHAQFDGLILSHHFGIKPKNWLCTLSMARYLHGRRRSLSLEKLAEHYGLGEKSIDYDSFKGKQAGDIDLAALGAGAAKDCDLTYALFRAMAAEFPAVEYPIVDTTIRMFTEPKLVGDVGLLASIRDTEFLNKNGRLYELGVGESDLQSAAKFTALLEAEGVDVEMKEGKNGPIPAIAKTDGFMRALCDSGDERVAALANGRLEVRSTLNETRAGRLHGMAERGGLPIYLYYCGAHTRRWSGGDAVNFQNLPRGAGLRKAVRAPPGYLIASPDQAQGECRILNWLAGQEDVVQRFRDGHDPYIPIASQFYRRAITKADAVERGTGKQLELSCGFGCGAEKFMITAGRGTYGPPVAMEPATAKTAVDLYRQTHASVVALWREAEQLLVELSGGHGWGHWRMFEFKHGRIYHPNGTWLDYSTLKYENREWRLLGRHGAWVKMYGAKLVENVVQWLSRIVTTEAMARFKTAGYPIVGMSHDDVWLLVPFNGVTDVCDSRYNLSVYKSEIIKLMRVTPDWAPGLPLDADCKMGETYS